jgi:hypothetical protein
MNRGRDRSNRRSGVTRWAVALFALAGLTLAGCSAKPDARDAEPTAAVVATRAPEAAGTQTATTAPAARSTAKARAASGAAAVAAPTRAAATTKAAPTPVAVPVLSDALAAGWDSQYSWTTQFEPSEERGPAGSAAHLTVFHGDDSGLFLAVKQDSPAPHLLANIMGARLWINPGERELPVEKLKFAVLSSDKLPYWDMGERPVPLDAAAAAEGEAALPGLKGALPVNKWTEVTVRFDELPTPPSGRYLTGLYLRGENLAGQRMLLSELELLALPDDTPPEPVSVSVIDVGTLRVTFNEDVDPRSAEEPANYRVTSETDAAHKSPQSPAAVAYEPETMSAVLTLGKPTQPGNDYTVEVQGLADLAPQPNRQAKPVALAFTATYMQVTVDLTQPLHPISPFIYGIAGNTPEYMRELRPRLTNWGGNPTSRYNWEIGNAFNAGSDWEYRNTDYGYPAGSATDKFIEDAKAVGADVRITLPTLGWVAKDTKNETCSFTGPDGKCYNPWATCQKPGKVADPNQANVPVDVEWVVRWVRHMIDEQGYDVRFFAMDNEPDLWGFTHYDVHPDCTTYEEILNKYLTYAVAVRAAARDAELLGPVSCCWYFYWNSAAGDADKAKHDNRDFLPWFLDQVRQHDEKAGVRTLDALDIHYYPENVYNDKDDPETAAARLQATRGLWDESYVDPSWIAQPVRLIPRMREIIAENYPGTELFLSEWNFGGDKSMSGALAIADALGIFGEQNLYAASYYQSPELNSPGFFGFRMHTNYDGRGGRFGDTSLPATSAKRDQVSAYASRDSKTGKTTVMLINKLPDLALPITLELDGLKTGRGELFRYGQDNLKEVVREPVELTASSTIELPPYSITLLVLPQQGK